MNEQTISVQRIATGGEGVGHLADGRVVFVPGVLPGEDVHIEITEKKKRFARGHALEVLTASADRIEPDCAHVAEGCGGCDWRHVAPARQREFKAQIVRDVLSRIGRIEAPQVAVGPAAGTQRTTVRSVVHRGRAGYRRRKSHSAIRVKACPAAHPLVEEILVDGRFGAAAEISVRVGSRSGERLVLVSPSIEDVDVPHGVRIIGRDDLDAGRNAWITEEVGGRNWRISAGSFFQSSSGGAEALASAVRAEVDTAGDGHLVDLYSGVGLLAGLCAGDREVTAVESSASSVADARVNIPNARIIHHRVENWKPQPASVVIADPARSGLGDKAVDIIAATGANDLVLVSCDPGALGRDATLLTAAGFTFQHATTVEMFPNTSHIETVSRFSR